MNTQRKNAAIIGIGLLGSSLGMALKNSGYERSGWTRRPDVTQWALEHGVIDRGYATPEEAFSDADILILCVPIPQIIEYIRQYSHLMKPGALLTDIGSVKSVVEKAALSVNARFIGGHPMAGTEKTGPENGFPTLYANADVFVVPPAGAREEDTAEVEKLWRSIGTNTTRINAEEHDNLVAHTSHLTHVVASALTLATLDVDSEAKRRLRFSGSATGFRDTSRIASSSPQMWREIIEHNVPAVVDSLRSFAKRFEAMAEQIQSGDFDGFEHEFGRGKALRDEWMKYKKY